MARLMYIEYLLCVTNINILNQTKCEYRALDRASLFISYENISDGVLE